MPPRTSSAAIVHITVPGSTSNLGPGFDCMGLAVELTCQVTARRSTGTLTVRWRGPARNHPLAQEPARHLAEQALAAWSAAAGQPVPPLDLTFSTQVPLGRGLGSSATAIVGALLAANAFAVKPLTRARLAYVAACLEGHPDNALPALYGGLVISTILEDRVLFQRIAVPASLRLVVLLPEAVLLTKAAREVLPERVPRRDAVWNVGRAAVLSALIAKGRWKDLWPTSADRLHQPYRAALVPWLDLAIEAARRAGAYTAFLSGAGPSVAALCHEREVDRVARAFRRVLRECQEPGMVRVLRLRNRGAVVQ